MFALCPGSLTTPGVRWGTGLHDFPLSRYETDE
ncbi:hypothetical protein NPIL_4451, partial [Nephila pilipes]